MVIVDFDKLDEIKGEKLIFVIGTFDLLHVGHLFFLKKAKEIAFDHKLLVGIISDKIVKKVKGDQRPIISEKQRAELVDALKIVDYVLVAPEIPTGEVSKKVLEMVKPEYAVANKSAWEKRENPFEVTGTKLILLEDEITGVSTSGIISRIKN